MPYCPKCGVENPAAARFCDQCGATLIPVPAPVAPAPVYTPPVKPAAAPPPPRPVASASGGSAVQCAQCGASALPGEAFCDNCGAPLLAGTPAPSVAAGVAPQAVYPAPVPSAAPAVSFPPPVAAPVAPAIPAGRAALAPARLVLKSGASLALPAAPQVVIGRSDPVSNFTPDLDLAAHGAVDSGVGRRHARLFVQQGQVMVEDLESTNGTFLNGARLQPRQARPLQNQDTLQLGSLALQFLL